MGFIPLIVLIVVVWLVYKNVKSRRNRTENVQTQPGDAQSHKGLSGATSREKKVLYGLLAFLGLVILIPAIVPVSPVSYVSLPDKNKPVDFLTTVGMCEYTWARHFSSILKDPSSLEWVESKAAASEKDGKPIVLVPYRAKNSFGAYDFGVAICQVNFTTGDVITVYEP